MINKNASYGLRVRGVGLPNLPDLSISGLILLNQKIIRHIKTTLFILAFILLSRFNIHAQSDTINYDKEPFVSGAWFQLGAGVSSMPGPYQGIGVNMRFLNHILFSVQLNNTWAFKPTDSSGFTDVAVMVGCQYQYKKFAFSGSTGISNYVGVVAYTGDREKGLGRYDYTFYSGPGIALRGSAMYMFSKHFATSLDLYGSVSSSISRVMLSLNIIYSPFKWDGR